MAEHHCDNIQILWNKQLRRSKDRQSLIRLFQEKRPWKPEQIIARAIHSERSTIFRNIKLFQERKIIKRIKLSSSGVYYELADRKHHAHKICDKCGAAKCIPCPVKIKKKHRLDIIETCSNCK